VLILPTVAAADPPPAQAQTALNSLLRSPDHPLPPGTQLLGVAVQNGLATVNFSPAFTNNFQGGDSQAADTVNAVLRVLGRVPTISKVQFLENGRVPGSMGGLIVLSSPLPVIHSSATPMLYYHRSLAAHRGKTAAR
jgi:spore germination protein GerM